LKGRAKVIRPLTRRFGHAAKKGTVLSHVLQWFGGLLFGDLQFAISIGYLCFLERHLDQKWAVVHAGGAGVLEHLGSPQ
jgi:hypothetical protein